MNSPQPELVGGGTGRFSQLSGGSPLAKETARRLGRSAKDAACAAAFAVDRVLNRIDIPVRHLVLFGLVPLSIGFLLFQGYLVTKTDAYVADTIGGRDAVIKTGLFNLNESLVETVQTDILQSVAKRRELGYVEVTIPDQVVHFLNEAEKDWAAEDEAADQQHPAWGSEDGRIIVEAEKHPVRLSPPRELGPIVVSPMPDQPNYSKNDRFELTWSYDLDEKLPPYTGNKFWLDQFAPESRAYWNSLATFPYASNEGPLWRYHGHVGVYPNGTQAWKSIDMPPPIESAPEGRKEAMKNGGFYLALSNALPLDRITNDTRDEVCKSEQWDYNELRDASVVITFHNEPLSTLLRSVHSVLNQTPPPILREIILVDDHSNLTENLPGSELYDYIQLLPKVKLMRLPERRGLVWARLAGAQAAKAPVLVVLDSHIEVNRGWLEPQLKRLADSPKSIVYPQILALQADSFGYNAHAGIGCWLSWKWNMIEKASLTGSVDKTDPIPSASMAGGLFAVNVDWFWELGGYDEDFAMWGSENVEMGFRVWMCGGRMECLPCARTYHIYRDGGMGYSSPSTAVWRNKIRTARVWLDEWFQIAQKFIGKDDGDIGNLDHVLELKQRLNCKPFSWFFENVDPKHDGRNMTDIEVFGAVANRKFTDLCIDTMSHLKVNETYGLFHCHGGGGSQGWYKTRTRPNIRPFLDDTKCLSNLDGRPVFWHCYEDWKVDHWELTHEGMLKFKTKDLEVCLQATENARGTTNNLEFAVCNPNEERQLWNAERFEPDPNFALPDFSPEYKRLHGMV